MPEAKKRAKQKPPRQSCAGDTMQKPPRQSCAGGRIFLRGLRLSCFIGVDAAEKHARQAVVMDVEITPLVTDVEMPPPVDKKRAGGGLPTPAVDYAVLSRRLREWAEQTRHRYAEDLAAAAADMVIGEFAAAEVRIYCAKIRPFPGLDQFGAEAVRAKA